jgi:hypothetical protein
MKAAGIPKNASEIGGFINGAHALITMCCLAGIPSDVPRARLGLALVPRAQAVPRAQTP